MPLSDHFTSISHHAYCLTGGASTCIELKDLLEKVHNIPSQGNPDFYEQTYETLTIEHSREIKALHDTRPIGTTGKKVFIITTDSITVEAQNALLKLLEEPGDYAHFFIIIPSTHILLPTVKSRLQFIENESRSRGVRGDNNGARENPHTEEVEKFLKMSAAKKLDFIKKLVDDISKEKKKRQDAIDFLDAVEAVVHSKGMMKENLKTMESIALVRKYIYDRAPSVKMLLEYMTLGLK